MQLNFIYFSVIFRENLMIRNIKTTLLSTLLFSFFLSFFMPFAVVSAAAPRCYNFDGTSSVTCQSDPTLKDDHCYTEVRGGPNGTLTGYSETSCADPTDRDKDGTGLAKQKTVKNDCNDSATLTKDNCAIIKYIVILIQVLSVIVGVVVVTVIIIGGIQYSASADDPQAVAAAKKRIINAIIAIVLYFFGFALLQFLVPGGIL